MASFGVVEVAERLDCTPAKREVQDVAVLERPDIRAKIEGCAKKD
jgi:hypothetical protein